MDIEFVGGVAKSAVPKRDLQRRMERFLKTQPIYETKTMLLDVMNLFQRSFMCCKGNCDFLVKYEEENKSLLFNEPNRILSCDRGCCEGGSLEIDSSTSKNIDDNIDDIYQYMAPECAKYVELHGWKRKVGNYSAVRAFPKDNRCVFTIVEDGMSLCALHRYALMTDRPVLDFKPFECWMFPMDVLRVDGKLLFTCISEVGDTYGILRWGDNHAIQSCLRKTENGIPFYQYSKDIIVKVAGEKRYDLIDKIYRSGRWKKLLKESGRR